MPTTKSLKVADMQKEYRFDYSKAKPNRFASRKTGKLLMVIIRKLGLKFIICRHSQDDSIIYQDGSTKNIG